jgi:4-hydroxythreonine-4-phosphate dehydrogenase
MANSGEAAARSIEAAAQDCRAGRLDAMVTAPIHKGALALTGRTFPGHTEMLASLCDPAHPPSVRMMLVNPHLRVVLNSIHLPLRMAIEQLNSEALLETLHITHQALSQRFSRPLRIALAGLNPHASDGGLFGSEEAEILSPTVARARALGLPVSGPHSPDSVFRQAWGLSAETRKFDVVVCLYHDQGLIPVKLLGIDDGVNCTLGLPFIRTSVDHGTAFEIAGQNQASPDSMIAAIHTAARLCRGGI